MNLRHLIEVMRRQGTDVEVAAEPGALDQELRAVTNRPSEAGPQVLLVVEPSAGPSAVGEALRRGVAALVMEEPVSSPVPVLRVPRSREALRHLLALFYGDPSQRLLLWGVTGPGQTMTSFFLQRCLAEAGLSPGLWADVWGTGGRSRGTGFPAGLLLFLRDLAERGGRSAALSLCPEELAVSDGAGPALQGLVYLGERGGSSPVPIAEAPLVVVPAARHRLPSPGAAIRFGPAAGADLQYRPILRPGSPAGGSPNWTRLSRAVRWTQEVEFRVGPRLATMAGVVPAPTSWQARLSTPGPAARRSAAAASAAALLAGVPAAAAASALSAFPGLYRRFQLVHDGRFAVVDDVAQTPREVASVLVALAEAEAASFSAGAGPLYRRLLPVSAVAGGRGPAVNARLGQTLAHLLPRRRAERLIATESDSDASPELCVTPEERVALVAACRGRGLPVDYYPGLEDALAAAVHLARDGDLILLLGGPGMNRAQAVLAEVLASRSFLFPTEPFEEWGAEPFLRPLPLGQLTRRENLPGSRERPQKPRT